MGNPSASSSSAKLRRLLLAGFKGFLGLTAAVAAIEEDLDWGLVDLVVAEPLVVVGLLFLSSTSSSSASPPRRRKLRALLLILRWRSGGGAVAAFLESFRSKVILITRELGNLCGLYEMWAGGLFGSV